MIYAVLYIVVSVIAVFGGGIWLAVTTLAKGEGNAKTPRD
jgi:cytochrome c oxidase assembly factor CtaG